MSRKLFREYALLFTSASIKIQQTTRNGNDIFQSRFDQYSSLRRLKRKKSLFWRHWVVINSTVSNLFLVQFTTTEISIVFRSASVKICLKRAVTYFKVEQAHWKRKPHQAMEWKRIYSLPFVVAIETKLWEFQNKLDIHIHPDAIFVKRNSNPSKSYFSFVSQQRSLASIFLLEKQTKCFCKNPYLVSYLVKQ